MRNGLVEEGQASSENAYATCAACILHYHKMHICCRACAIGMHSSMDDVVAAATQASLLRVCQPSNTNSIHIYIYTVSYSYHK